jgi:hypothetical protein
MHSFNANAHTTSSTATDTAGYIAVDTTNKAIVLAFRGSTQSATGSLMPLSPTLTPTSATAVSPNWASGAPG